ncbi:glycosyltransferase family 32 protein [Alistipes sp. ZOR0009]|uniref:glycosyltransferase family 32 protein n=1 Tax=Alistipes sp. ZOR0009 TaxID=1339253 RepID=UPI001E5C3D21|nr:glycosyltransferase [Alistipes sp. ZOR0009]
MYLAIKKHKNIKTSKSDLLSNIENEINWDCQLHRFYYSDHVEYNQIMMCSIKHFFENESEGIILDFYFKTSKKVTIDHFKYCSILLQKYSTDERIGHITCDDFLKRKNGSDSYFFSKILHTSFIWASWRRVWEHIDSQIFDYVTFQKMSISQKISISKPFDFYWNNLNLKPDKYNNESWKSIYEYTNLINNRLSIIPTYGLFKSNKHSKENIDIIHPKFIVDDYILDLNYQELKYNISTITNNYPDGYSFIKNKLLSFSNKIVDQLIIPKIIHQVYVNQDGPPPFFKRIATTWQKKHPEWKYIFWDEKKINHLLESEFPDFIPFYESLPYDIQRWDTIRYLILYKLGGVYVDMDYECIDPIDVLLVNSSCCMALEPSINAKKHNKKQIISNAFMASIPQHSFIKNIINEIIQNINTIFSKKDITMHILESTGPFMLSRLYEKYKQKNDITLLSADLVTPLTMNEVNLLFSGGANEEIRNKINNSFAIHYFCGSWISKFR